MSAVPAANALTRRWAATLSGESCVLSGACVWPLLALLASGASEPARSELLAVVGSTTDPLDLSGVGAAVGIWTRADVPLSPSWQPGDVHHVLTTRDALDEWARLRTGGLVERMPVSLDESTLLVLASALAVRTTWDEPFSSTGTGLYRRSYDLSTVGVAAGVTVAVVRGSDDVDVLLGLGAPGRPPGEVVAALVDARVVPSTDGPGMSVSEVPSHDGRPVVVLHTVPFTVRSSHDLLALAPLFGLVSASDRSRGHFPGISPVDLAVDQARQDAVATFSATGFEAAAVTSIGMVTTSMPSGRAMQVDVRFDRAFGFAAVHRPSGLVLVAGWVADGH